MSHSSDRIIKIGINGADLEGHGTGVARYLASVMRFFSLQGREYYVYSRAPLKEDYLENMPNFNFIATGHPSDYSYTLWEQFILPRYLKKDGIDVFFSAGNGLPIRIKIPMLVVIHDLVFFVHPEWFSRREGLRRKVITRLSAKKARKIFTISNFSKSEIRKFLKTPPDKIIVAPTAPMDSVNEKINPSLILRVRDKAGIEGRFILFVGLLLERRSIRELIKAFSILYSKYNDLSLILVGKNQLENVDSIDSLSASYGVDKGVKHFSYLDDEELRALYHAADVFVYLSEYEGFGIPPLEAISAGTPVVTSNKTALKEIYSDSALLVNDHNPEEIAENVEKLLVDHNLRNSILKNSERLLQKYSWAETAEAINREFDFIIAGLD